MTERLGVPAWLLRPALLVSLTLALRFLLGFAVRELVSVISLLIRGVPPLALADRLLGILPAVALGAVLAVALVAVARALPLGAGVDRQIDNSWLVRARPAGRGAPARLGIGSAYPSPRVNGYALGVGWGVPGDRAGRLRDPALVAARADAPTRRMTSRTTAILNGRPVARARLARGAGRRGDGSGLFALRLHADRFNRPPTTRSGDQRRRRVKSPHLTTALPSPLVQVLKSTVTRLPSRLTAWRFTGRPPPSSGRRPVRERGCVIRAKRPRRPLPPASARKRMTRPGGVPAPQLVVVERYDLFPVHQVDARPERKTGVPGEA
jgi:hypothetical protein